MARVPKLNHLSATCRPRGFNDRVVRSLLRGLLLTHGPFTTAEGFSRDVFRVLVGHDLAEVDLDRFRGCVLTFPLFLSLCLLLVVAAPHLS